MSGINPAEKVGLGLVNHLKESVADASLAVQNFVDCMHKDRRIGCLRSAWVRIKAAVDSFKTAQDNKIVQKAYCGDLVTQFQKLAKLKIRLQDELHARGMV